jgi:adenylate cyclase
MATSDFVRKHGKWMVVTIVTWSLAKQLFLAIKLWGLENTLLTQVELSSAQLFAAVAISGIVDGFVFGLSDHFFDARLKSVTFIRKVFVKTIFNICLGIMMTFLFVSLLPEGPANREALLISKLLTAANLVVFGVYFFLITFMLQAAKNICSWIQTHHISQLFSQSGTGVQENRIFMFLDMKSSTTHAERLGISRYSNMIRDCFDDLAPAVMKTDAELYQYAGDEVIFSWKTSENNFVQAIELFFLFRQRLSDRYEYYEQKYGVAPSFKAGIHHGDVMRVLVNVNRMATAYHGDAINTAARIQGKCNELGCDLLVSDPMAIVLQEYFQLRWEGKFMLRGKYTELGLFSVEGRVTVSVNSEPRQPVTIRNSRLKDFQLWLNVF